MTANGKGDAPRNNFSPKYRERYDQIDWSKNRNKKKNFSNKNGNKWTIDTDEQEADKISKKREGQKSSTEGEG